MHEWVTDNDHTPHLVVDATAPGIDVPAQFVDDGKIVLNVGYAATKNLVLGNEEITFEARFSGVPRQVRIPMRATLGIYSKETGEGLLFADRDSVAIDAEDSPVSSVTDSDSADQPSGEGSSGGAHRPHLRVIK